MSTYILKGFSKGIKTEIETVWLNTNLTFINNYIFNGQGKSLFKQKMYDFEIFGIKNGNNIEFIKVYPSLQHCVKYNGTIDENRIQILSNNSYGELSIELE